MTKPIHLKPSEVRRLERNLSGKKGTPREDPADTIRRLRAEIAQLREQLDQKQKVTCQEFCVEHYDIGGGCTCGKHNQPTGGRHNL